MVDLFLLLLDAIIPSITTALSASLGVKSTTILYIFLIQLFISIPEVIFFEGEGSYAYQTNLLL